MKDFLFYIKENAVHILLAILVSVAFIGVIFLFGIYPFMQVSAEGSSGSNVENVEMTANINVTPDTETMENVKNTSDYTFERGEIQFITAQSSGSHKYWEADVYFPERDKTYVVTLPESVLDDIYVGWVGYFGFRPHNYNPHWAGLTFIP